VTTDVGVSSDQAVLVEPVDCAQFARFSGAFAPATAALRSRGSWFEVLEAAGGFEAIVSAEFDHPTDGTFHGNTASGSKPSDASSAVQERPFCTGSVSRSSTAVRGIRQNRRRSGESCDLFVIF